ncbi:MAG TPA: two-component regulator propeller domain-containing protein [Pyrinomonadaceae bacterium]|nr:two-component regulator propeller domain-containing protein [Pyrinomonadaceae bacterium]
MLKGQLKNLPAKVNTRSVLVFTLALLCGGNRVLGLNPNKDLSEFSNQVWLTENGLPQNTVQTIIQTRDGYLWFGTQEGLAKFNGTNFVVFDRENTPQLKSNDIRSFLEDRNGNLWIGTSFGLARMQGAGFTSFTTTEGLPDNTIGPMIEDPDGTLWIGTGSGLVHYSNNTFTSISIPDFGGTDVQSVLRDKSGVVWIGTALGVTSIQNGSVLQTKAMSELAGRSVNSMVEDQRGRVWYGTDTGLVGISNNQVLSLTINDGLPDNHVNYLRTDQEGCVWVGTSGGLARLSLVNNQPKLTTTEGLSSNLILSVFEDREGSVWIGTESGGLNVLRDRKFTTFTSKNGLSSDLVKAIYQDSTGALWIGTNGGGLNVLKDGQVKTYTTKDGLSSNVVLSLYGDNKGTIWIGTPDGLNEFRDGHFTTLTVAEGLSSDLVRSIFVDRNGSVWVGTRNGLNRIKDGQFTIYTTKEGLANDFIGTVSETSDGALWIGTRAGLSEYKDGRFTNFTTKDGLSNDVVTSLFEDSDKNLWVGTNGGGLNRLHDRKFVSYTTHNGLSDNVIYRILEDNQRNLWCTSPKGIFKISLNELSEFADGRIQAVSPTSFGTSDGMLTRECSGGGYPAGWKGADGKLWFPTIKGIAMIDPNNAQFNKEPPPVVIEEIRADDHQIASQNGLQLSAGTTRLEFYFAALSFVAPDKVRFKYKLEGFDPAWIDADTRRSASYTNLRPGNYTFHVIASNNDGVWNSQGASFQFYWRPHFYQTYWFYLSLLLLLAFAVWQTYRLRVRRMQRQFDAVLAERTRIAREIHDNLAQEMLGISVQLEVVARTMPSGADVAQTHLDRVRMLVRHGIAEARRYVWDLRSQALDKADFPTALADTARRLTADSPVEAQVEISGVFRPLPATIEDNLLRIGQEAINNAVSHANARLLVVKMIFDIQRVQLSVRDDGRGFDVATGIKNGHFGLVGMRERAERIGGTLNIMSSTDIGTEVVVDVPISN